MMRLIRRLACRIFGHGGPFNPGRQGNETGKFCLMCDRFVPYEKAPDMKSEAKEKTPGPTSR